MLTLLHDRQILDNKKQGGENVGKKNRHHCRPRSRGGTDQGNIIRKDVREHAAYHELFGNMTVEEIICCILMEWTTPEWRDQFRKDYDSRLDRIEGMLFPQTR